jgi:3-hydroxyisobutyrate dehydrogenase-like beta-hydroxyacid dehydrogenase
MHVGLLGTGRMGTAMGERLLSAGYRLTVHNRTPARAAELMDRGAGWAATPADLARDCDVVLSVLLDDDAVEAAYRGPDGLLAGATIRSGRPAAEAVADPESGPIFVECATIRTRTVRDLAVAVHAAGARLVDAPLAGPPDAARAGGLLVLAGGAQPDVDRVMPVLATFARRVVHLGPVGSGTTMKLVMMAPLGSYFAALAEALAMGTQAGLDRADMLDVLLDSHGAPPALRDRAELLRGADRDTSFDVAGVRKDLRAIVATGQDFGVPTAVTAAAQATFSAAAAGGFAQRDLIFVVDYVRSVAEQPD